MEKIRIIKSLAIILVLAMVLSLFACKSPSNTEISSGESSDQTLEHADSEKDTEATQESHEKDSINETDSEAASESGYIKDEEKSEVTVEDKTEDKTEITTEESKETETEGTDHTLEYRELDSSSGYIGRYIDYIMLDEEKILITSSAMSVKLIDVNTSDTTLLFKGWAGFQGEILKLGYAFDNQAPVFDTDPMQAESGVIEAAGELAKRFMVTVDISGLTCGYHDFYLLAQIDIEGGIYVKLLSFRIFKSEALDPSDYIDPSDADVVRYNVDSAKLDGSIIMTGVNTKNLKAVDSTSLSQKLTFTGWAGFKHEILSLGYAFDNEAPILNTAPTDTSEPAVLNAGGNLAKRFTVNADISKLSVGEHTMYLLAFVNVDGGKAVKLMEFTLTVNEQCAHNSEDTVWTAISGEARETATCALCGETITRSTNFILCYEKIRHGGGDKIGSVVVLDSAHTVDDISDAFVTDKGLYIQGWLGINSGTKEYKWSVDGKEWFDVDAGAAYKDDAADVLAAIAKRSDENKLGLKDYASKIRFAFTISGISKLQAGKYDVYLGAVPNNNPNTVVPIMKVENVTVASAPDEDTALKTINGTAVSDYKIVIEGTHYGVQRAGALLAKELYLASGTALPVVNGGSAGAKTILIRSSDTYNGGAVSGGEYYLIAEGDSIIIGGSGIYGPVAAAKAFAEAISEKTDAEITSGTFAMLDMSGTKEKLMGNGDLNIGFIGDSVTFGHGSVTPWTSYLVNSLKDAYEGCTVNALNVAKSGSTSLWGKNNIKELLLDKGYNDLVFLSHGTNDKFYGVDYTQTYEDYVSMIEQIRASNPNADIVFVFCGRDFETKGIFGLSGGSVSPFMRAMIDVALEYDLAIIDPMTTLYEACLEKAPDSAMNSGWKYYMQDEVHPNTIGQELYGEVVYSYVSAALK